MNEMTQQSKVKVVQSANLVFRVPEFGSKKMIKYSHQARFAAAQEE